MSEQMTADLSSLEAKGAFTYAPSGEDLKLKDSDFALFQKLVDWQKASEESQIVLGKPLS